MDIGLHTPNRFSHPQQVCRWLKWINAIPGVRADPALAAHGIAQTKELTKHILSLPSLPQRIYCSPYYRCIQTIVPLARALKLPVYIDEGIGEWYGLLHHSSSPDHPTPLTTDEWPKFFPGVEFCPGITGIVADRRGETMAGIHGRVQKTLDKIIKDAGEQGLETILLCTHAATNIALGRALTHDPDADIRTGTASLGEYVRDTTDPQRWKCIRNGDASFLSGGEERNWWFDGDVPGDDPEVAALYADVEDKSEL